MKKERTFGLNVNLNRLNNEIISEKAELPFFLFVCVFQVHKKALDLYLFIFNFDLLNTFIHTNFYILSLRLVVRSCGGVVGFSRSETHVLLVLFLGGILIWLA